MELANSSPSDCEFNAPLDQARVASDNRDSQSAIIGSYVIIFGAGRHPEYSALELLLTASPSDATPRVPDSSIHLEMGPLPL